MPLDIASLHANYQPLQFDAPQQQTAKKKGNFLTQNLPTLGGIGGGIGGGAAGGALAGTAIFPGVGTAVGGLLGALLGGAAGGGLGKVAENKVEGNALGDGVTGAAIENGVLSAGPLRLGKGAVVAAKAGTGLLRGGAKASLAEALAARSAQQPLLAGVEDLTKNTAGKVATSSGKLTSKVAGTYAPTIGRDGVQASTGSADDVLKTSFQGKLKDWGNNQLAKQWGTLDKPTIRATNPSKTVGELADMGVVKPQDAERIAGKFTGADGIVNQAVLKAVGDAGSVPTHNVQSVLDNAIKEHGLVSKDAASVRQVVEAQMGKLGEGDASPSKVLGVMKSIEKRVADLQGKGGNYRMQTPERLDQAKALQSVHKELEDSLYKTAGANSNVASVLTPEFRSSLVSLHPSNPQWQKFVDDKVMKSTDVNHLRGTMAPFVRANQMIDNAASNSFSMGGKIGNAIDNGQVPSIRGLATSTVAKLARDPALRKVGTVARNTADAGATTPLEAVTKAATGSLPTSGAPGLAAALTAPTKKAIIRNGVIGNNVLAGTQSADAMGADQSAMTDTTGQLDTNSLSNAADTTASTPDATAAATAAASPFDPANVEANVAKLLQNGGTLKDVQSYLDIASTVQKMQAASSSGGGLSATTGGLLAQSANGESTLNQLEQLYAQTGSGSGKVGGGLQNAMAKVGLNDNASAYNSLSASTVSQLAKALNGGGQVSDSDAAVVIQALPKITDSPQVAKLKFAALKQRLQNAQANTLTYSGGNQTDLVSALNGQ